MTNSNATGRVDPVAAADLDLSEFAPKPVSRPVVARETIRQASEQSGFPSRAPEKRVATKPVQQRRRRTGRNVQFNIKATPETIARFTSLADKRGLVFGELLERALDALERSPSSART